LRSQDRSLFHRIQSDELWHFHAGSALSIFILDQERLEISKLGSNIDRGESLQVIVPAGKWFGALVDNPDDYTLSGCTVAPGFDFADFEMATRDELLQEFPAHREIIVKLTK
jgi:predicted cupin superfamily sugar epimerase